MTDGPPRRRVPPRWTHLPNGRVQACTFIVSPLKVLGHEYMPASLFAIRARVLETGRVSDSQIWEEPHPEAVVLQGRV